MTRPRGFAARTWLWLCRLAALLGFTMILVTATPVLRYWVAALSTQWGTEDGDTLIVLGQDITGPEMLGIGSYWRSFYAVLVWRENHFRRVVVTGKDVAPLMRDLMVNQGVPREAVIVENAATSTRENALFVSQLLGQSGGRNILLTSDFHMGRALRAFQKAGVTASPLPFPDAYKQMNRFSTRWDVFIELAGETAKVVYYKAKGWI